MPTVIQRLTAEQEAALPLWRARYLERGTATGPCDRPAIEAAITKLYESQARKAPGLVIWMDSPLGGLFAAGVLAGYVKSGQLGGQLGDELRGQLRGQLGGQLWDQLGGQLGGQLRDQLGDQLRDQLGGQLWGQLYQCGWGQHDGSWLGWLTFGRYLGAKLEPAGGLDALDGLCDAGWWWPFEGVVVLTDRPTVLSRDERGRLHSESGPAICYADGWGIHAWHGVRVEPDVIETPADQITAKRLSSEKNAEVRRVLVERIGAERYMAIAKASKVATDDWGTLWAATTPEPMRVVELVNSTPEPDGHSKVYWIRVPETAERRDRDRCVGCDVDLAVVPQTPHQAVAWSYSCCTACYQPAVMT